MTRPYIHMSEVKIRDQYATEDVKKNICRQLPGVRLLYYSISGYEITKSGQLMSCH